jgi:hypothetical protein
MRRQIWLGVAIGDVVNQHKKYWENLKNSEKIIFASFFFGFFSMFLDWSYGGFFPQNGFTQLTIFLLSLWAYPIFKIISGKKIKRSIGFGFSFAASIAALTYIFSKNMEIFGGFINLAGIGAWIFLFSSLGLGYGVYKNDLEYQAQYTSSLNPKATELLPPDNS